MLARALRRAQQLSLPLFAGVFVALAFANLAPELYHRILEFRPFGELAIFHHVVDVHFLVNDVFMVFFFGIAAKEITEALHPGGSLNPPARAINPLLATLGGVLGPVVVFLTSLTIAFQAGAFPAGAALPELARGWGVPTATDIALAWLVARMVFGPGHPAINFLLLLAIADDAIGLVIIAVFYPSPEHPPAPEWLGLVLLAMGVAYALRRRQPQGWLPIVGIAGPIAWCGLLLAGLHPALALVAIVPFLPLSRPKGGAMHEVAATGVVEDERHPPLLAFEHQTKAFVDWGLFAFAFANAGVTFERLGPLTLCILGALVVGKTAGVTSLGLLARRLGFPLPAGMNVRELCVAGFVAALGLTVALFVASVAFVDPHLQGEAKMGALLSGLVGLAAVPLARLLGVRPAPRGGTQAPPR
ncbi:MAG TPA: Na+/H+ antiporter NhaA [Planctomycetota bacterium]|nr:Na+/H+ antiporter NhaA [Planctomycetota bacterium]